jgi:hypothetical protein
VEAERRKRACSSISCLSFKDIPEFCLQEPPTTIPKRKKRVDADGLGNLLHLMAYTGLL